MKNKFIKTLCSFQIGVNVIGLPLHMELKTKQIEQASLFTFKQGLQLFSTITL